MSCEAFHSWYIPFVYGTFSCFYFIVFNLYCNNVYLDVYNQCVLYTFWFAIYILTHFALIYYLIYYFSFMLYSSNLIFHIICVSSICIAKCIFFNFFRMICNFALVRIVYYDLFTYDFIKMANIWYICWPF